MMVKIMLNINQKLMSLLFLLSYNFLTFKLSILNTKPYYDTNYIWQGFSMKSNVLVYILITII